MAAGETPASEDFQVVIYDFDPSTIVWPFRQQKTLPLHAGEKVKIIHDDGSGWILGEKVSAPGEPTKKGYFPKDYCVSHAEYLAMLGEMNDGVAVPAPEEESEDEDEDEEDEEGSEDFDDRPQEYDDYEDDEPADEPKYHPTAEKDADTALSSLPPIATAWDPTRSKSLREMPGVPVYEELGEEAGPRDQMENALWEMRREGQTIESAKESIADSRASTPATFSLTRPERDFVRSHIAVDLQQTNIRPVTLVEDMINKNIKLDREPLFKRMPVRADLRVRATTCRLAAGIEPPHMRIQRDLARHRGARWTHQFRPQLNDLVNESFKMGCDPCILSNYYLFDYYGREQFMRIHIKDTNGTMWFELTRKKQHLFYMQMDYVDVMMFHPDAWGFPDAGQVVHGIPGEPFDPFHGWLQQNAIDADSEMDDVTFMYSLRCRSLPESVFQQIALGKLPEWLAAFTELSGERKPKPAALKDTEMDKAVANLMTGPAISEELREMMEAGLADEDDLYVKVDELKAVQERTKAPDVLDLRMPSYRLKGQNAMRLFLRNRGNPDATREALVTPKQVKEMAFQLGITGKTQWYWYAYMVLRYALPQTWDCAVIGDTRLYINLETGEYQPIHPMIKQFRDHLADRQLNEFLWEYRGFLKMKCSECGIMDAGMWCMQCTDYYCVGCYVLQHKSNRGRKHWCMPLPGSRYLSSAEAREMEDLMPLLNIGFSNRRRFLARGNQSDKHGYTGGDHWLYFPKEAFAPALAQTPEKHWYLKRLNPPRLGPDAEGFYYNFQSDIVADDPQHVLMKQEEQNACLLIQRFVRAALIRRRLMKMKVATVVIQKYKRMVDCMRFYGKHGTNSMILRRWYRKFQANNDFESLNTKISKFQAIYRGRLDMKAQDFVKRSIMRVQGWFRKLLTQKRMTIFNSAATAIERVVRGQFYGRGRVSEMQPEAVRIQSMIRGAILVRERRRKMVFMTVKIQKLVRGVQTRGRQEKIRMSATLIQSNWRRWQEVLEHKIRVYEEYARLFHERKQLMRDKMAELAALLIQRNVRRHRDHKRYVLMRREKTDADKRISTVLAAMFMGASQCEHFIHPWIRHLPPEITEVLIQIKGSLQRSLALVPIRGKLANEEIGRKSKRTSAADLTLNWEEEGPDLATHLLLSIVHHLLSHVPKGQFSETVRWTCYSLGHLAVSFKDAVPQPKQHITLGEQVPPRPGEPMVTLMKDMAHVKHHHDRVMTVPVENAHLLYLCTLPAHLRHVFLTANTLITVRQALDLPSLSTDDHLSFQGVDSEVAAQLQDLLSYESAHRFPPDWPKKHGTVYALASQQAKYLVHLRHKAKPPAPEPDTRGQGPIKGKSAANLTHFNRPALLRILQQQAYYMRDQEEVVNFLLLPPEDQRGSPTIRQSRYVTLIDKLFEVAYKGRHDHCPFALGVVLFHMIQRATMLRVLYHRSAIAIQVRWRYAKQKARRKKIMEPTMRIQRFWRAIRSAIRMAKYESSGDFLVANMKAVLRKTRNKHFVKCVLKIQRVWRGALGRIWVRRMHKKATKIQSVFRAHLIWATLDKDGKRASGRQGAERKALLKAYKEGKIHPERFISQLAIIRAKLVTTLYRHREKNLSSKRLSSLHGTNRKMREQKRATASANKGTVQAIRDSFAEPICFANRRLKQVGSSYGYSRSKVMDMVENVKRVLDRTNPREQTRQVHAVARRGNRIVQARIRSKKKTYEEQAQFFTDPEQFGAWQWRNFRTSIPWLPKEVGLRITCEGEEANLEMGYYLTTAFLGSVLSRADDRRPPWMKRMRLLATADLPPELQDHTANALRVVAAKFRGDANSNVAGCWAPSVRGAAALWRTCFACSVAKIAPAVAVPALFMCATQTLLEAFRTALSKLWLEMQEQFTTKSSKYRGLKSRPPWSTMDAIYMECFSQRAGFGIKKDSAAASAKGATAKASSLQDFAEEVLTIQFAIDICEYALDDAQEYGNGWMKRKAKAGGPSRRKRGQDEAEEADGFREAWVSDNEHRAVCHMASRLIVAADGPAGFMQAATVSMHLLLGVFTGFSPLLKDRGTRFLLQVSDAHAQAGKLPPFQVDDPEEAKGAVKYDIIALSYGDVAGEFKVLLSATPLATLNLVAKSQAVWRGYQLRVKYIERMKMFASYTKMCAWPPAPSAEERRERMAMTSPSKKSKPQTLEEQIDSAQPSVSKFLGGPDKSAKKEPKNLETTQAGAAAGGEAEDDDASGEEAVAQVRLTADHRACADFFALYMYTMYMRREMNNMWQGLTWSYDHLGEGFEDLLTRNKNLRPMVESVAAQLKRGALVGFDKAFGKKADGGAPAEMKSGMGASKSQEMFKRPDPAPAVAAGGGMRTERSAPALNLPLPPASPAGAKKDDDRPGTADYMKQYLVEMDGDDSQFKDIDANVVPLSSGSSPPRQRPDDVLFEAGWTTGQAPYDRLGATVDDVLRKKGGSQSGSVAGSRASSQASTPKRVSPDVPWCLARLKCIWLPIKAHRFTAHRSRVLQMLPAPVLQQYVDHEKSARYGACVKLLAVAVPGNLNVLEPANLPNKPLLIETVFQMLVGYLGLSLKNQQVGNAVSLLLQVLEAMPQALRDLHPGHRTVMEAYLYDTALSVAYYVHSDNALAQKAETFFTQASERYKKLGHSVRFAKCCCRYASFLAVRQQYHEGEYFLQQALNALKALPPNSLSVVATHNLAVLTGIQNRMPDALVHMRTYQAQCKQLPRLSNAWMQPLDNTQWILLKLQDLWPQHQHEHVAREATSGLV